MQCNLQQVELGDSAKKISIRFDSLVFSIRIDSIRFDSTSQKALKKFFCETSCEASNVAETVVVYIDI